LLLIELCQLKSTKCGILKFCFFYQTSICKLYFAALKKFGLRKIFSGVPSKIDFLQEHLLPAAYIADHESVHELLNLLFSGDFRKAANSGEVPLVSSPVVSDEDLRYDLVHFTRSETPYCSDVYKHSLLHVTAMLSNKRMMMDVVRAEYLVHRDKGMQRIRWCYLGMTIRKVQCQLSKIDLPER
jgi:hypothetical protein